MTSSITYFDNAATTFPKPDEVYLALDHSVRNSGNPGRGGHALALNSARTVFEGREAIAEFLGVRKSERLIFTPGCTQSINMVLSSLATVSPGVKSTSLNSNSVVLLSGLEHNAVMRPLHRLKSQLGFRTEMLPYKPGQFCDLADLHTCIKKYKPSLFILTEGSNVTGEIANLPAVADLCLSHSLPLLVDAAQTAGRFSNFLAHDGITYWCASAHKSLMGPQGLGLLFVHPEVDLEPLVAGGTGSASEQLEMPDVYPDHLEAGTMPSFLIAGLHAGVNWLQKTGIASIMAHEKMVADRFVKWAVGYPSVKLYGHSERLLGSLMEDTERLPVVSFELVGFRAEQVADALQRDMNIAVRSGLHCSVQAHKSLGTQSTGLVRASFGFYNTIDEVNTFCRYLEKLSGSITADSLEMPA